ncbi:MAG: ORF6N domain-containing protein [Candidatus Omnitrophota bacterium]
MSKKTIVCVETQNVASLHQIREMIFYVRGQKVMMDRDLAVLYGVPTKVFNQAVKRNIKRFPEDFMFQLTWEEVECSRSQFVTLKKGRGSNVKYTPFVFTEHGVAMLSSVLNSERAIQINILIMRTFTKLREMLSTHKELAFKMRELERKVGRHDDEINAIINVMKKLMRTPEDELRKKGIGFHVK